MNRLTPDLIPDTRLWRLYLEVCERTLEILVYSVHENQSLKYFSLPFDEAAPHRLKALEDLVYDNPLLLCDFERVSVLFSTQRYMLVPKEITSQQMIQDMVDDFWHEDKLAVLTEAVPTCDMTMAMALKQDILSFVRRTYPTARIMHSMWPLLTYFSNKYQHSASNMYVNIHGGSIDVIAFVNGRLKVANSYSTANTADRLYFIHLVARASGIDMERDEVMLSGAPQWREQLASGLRDYARYVMPVPFPSVMYQAGKQAMDAPFELIIMPLCE